MRNTLLTFFLLVSGISFSQEESVLTPIAEDSSHTDTDIDPQFPGGKAEMLNFIAENMHYPLEDVAGKCYMKFVVNKDGAISNIKVVRGIPDCLECDEELVRVIQLMPKWIPASIQGKPVASYFNLPISICL